MGDGQSATVLTASALWRTLAGLQQQHQQGDQVGTHSRASARREEGAACAGLGGGAPLQPAEALLCKTLWLQEQEVTEGSVRVCVWYLTAEVCFSTSGVCLAASQAKSEFTYQLEKGSNA